MNRLEQRFCDLHAAGRPALLPYITAGHPDCGTTVEILRRIDPLHCACVEIGIPYTDPIADGPVIQASFSAALAHGFKLDTLFSEIGAHRAEIAVPLIAMVSYSIVYRRDPRQFVSAAKAAGIDGLIVPDLAIEEADDLAATARQSGVSLIMMVAPTSDAVRRRRIVALSTPFIYCQSLAGVTGERQSLPAELTAQIRQLRAETDKPLCVGFGIATPAHVAAVCQIADGAIIGSAIVRRMNEAAARGEPPAAIAQCVSDAINELATGLPPRGAAPQ